MSHRWLTTTEAAELLGVHPNTIRNWADSGRLHVLRTAGNQRRFDPEELRRHALAVEKADEPGSDAAETTAAPPELRQPYLEALAEIAEVAASAGELRDVCARLASLTGTALGASTADIYLFEAERGVFNAFGGWQLEGVRPGEWDDMQDLPPDSYSDYLAMCQGSEGVLIDCRSPDLPPSEREDYARWGEISGITVPLRQAGELIGLLDLTSRDTEHVFDGDDLRFAQVVAAHVTSAIVSTRLLDAERSRASQMEALLSIAEAVNSSVGLPQALGNIAQEMGFALRADVANLYTYDDPSETMVRVARWDRLDPSDDYRVGTTYAADRYPSWAEAVATGRPVANVAGGIRTPTEPAAAPEADKAAVSWITVPLYQDELLRGLVDVYSRDAGHVFTDEDVVFAGAVARQVEIALRGSEIVERTQRHTGQLEQVLEATRAMNTAADPDAVMAEIVLGFGRSLDVSEPTLYEIDLEKQDLVVTHSYFLPSGSPDFSYLGERLSLHSLPKLAKPVNEGAPVILNRLMDESLNEAEIEFLDRYKTRALLSVPIMDEGRAIGVLEAAESRNERSFTSDDVRTAEIFAAQALAAMKRSRALERETERSADLVMLLTASATMSRSLELEAAMLDVCDAIAGSLGYPYITIYEWDPGAEAVTALLAYYGDRDEPLDESFAGTVYTAEAEPLLTSSLKNKTLVYLGSPADPRLTPGERESMRASETGSLVYVPMIFQDRAVGMLEVDFGEEGHDFSERELTILQAIANQAAIVLMNARLFDRQRQQAEELARTAGVRATLVRFGASLRARETAAGVVEEVGEALADLNLFDAGLVMLRDDRGQRYTVQACFGEGVRYRDVTVPDEDVRPLVEANERLPAEQIGEKAGIRRLVTRLDDLAGGETLRISTSRMISSPVLDQQGECVGLVLVRRGGSPEARATSRGEAASLVRLLSDQAGIAIRAAYRLVELQRNLDQAWVMNEVLTAVGSTLDVPELLRTAARGMRRVADFSDVAFWFLDAGGSEAEIVVLGAAEAMAAPVQAVVRQAASPVWQAIDAARAAVDNDVPEGGVEGMPNARSIVVIPLIAEGRPAGGVVVADTVAGRFDEATRLLFEQFVVPIGAALQNARLYERIRNLHLSNLQALSTALNVKDYYMLGHAPRVSAYSGLLCRKLGYPGDLVQQMEKAAYLHDIGRIGVPDHVLQKPDALTEREWALVRGHAAVSADIIKPIFPEEIYVAVRHHHERMDGCGYPDGLPAGELPELARILTIADAYDAMTSQRVYARSLTYEEAVKELRSCAGTQFDPALVEVFIEVLADLAQRRSEARTAAAEVVERVDWAEHATLRPAGGGGRAAYPAIEAALGTARRDHAGVTRVFTAVPTEGGFAFAAGSAERGELLARPGDPVQLADIPVDLEQDTAANVLHVDGSGCWMSGFAPVLDADGKVQVIVEADALVSTDVRGGAVWSDVGDTLDSILRQAAARMTQIEMAANTDGLTGLYNHRYFQERLDQEVARARSNDEHLSLLFADLDRFKEFNDNAGHQAGNDALRRLSTLLSGELRRVDIAARYGGEEFAIILPDTGSDGAAEVAERVRRAVEAEWSGRGSGAELTISIGVATFPEDAVAGNEMIDKADWAMYRAKRKGRNKVEVFTAEASATAEGWGDRRATDAPDAADGGGAGDRKNVDAGEAGGQAGGDAGPDGTSGGESPPRADA